MGNFVLQSGGQLVDISGGDIQRHAVAQQWRTAASNNVAANLNQKSLYDVRIELQRRNPHQFAQRAPDRKWLAIRSRTGHGVELSAKPTIRTAMGRSSCANSSGYPEPSLRSWCQRTVSGIFGQGNSTLLTISWPTIVWSAISRTLFVQRSGLAEEPAIDRNFTDVVQISGAAQGRDLGRLHPYSLADRGGVAADA